MDRRTPRAYRLLWCVVETEARHDAPAVRDGWEAHLLIFRSGTADQILGAVEETVAGLPGARVPIAGYDPTRLTPVPAPPPVACSPTAR